MTGVTPRVYALGMAPIPASTSEAASKLMENRGRARKAVLLAAAAIKQDVEADDLETLDRLGWAALTALADVRFPSDDSKAAVIDLVRRVDQGRL